MGEPQGVFDFYFKICLSFSNATKQGQLAEGGARYKTDTEIKGDLNKMKIEENRKHLLVVLF